MSNQKRSHETVDPDYADVGDQQAKRQRALEQDAKEHVSRKIEGIVKTEFEKEISSKEKELQDIDSRLNKALLTMDRLRACIVATYYGQGATSSSAQLSSIDAPPPSIHPAVKKHIGKAPRGTSLAPRQTPEAPKLSAEVEKVENSLVGASQERLEPGTSASDTAQQGPSARVTYNPTPVVKVETAPPVFEERHARFKEKRKIIVGNVSKYIPVDNREPNDMSSHKWMVYVRGPRNNADISGFVRKVWFFLHHSYKPNDLVEISSPPFHLTRRGWGEFPVRVQLHFVDPRNKKVDIIHHLKLDKTFTGLQTPGAETIIQVEIEKDSISAAEEPAASSLSSSSQLVPKSLSLVKREPGSESAVSSTGKTDSAAETGDGSYWLEEECGASLKAGEVGVEGEEMEEEMRETGEDEGYHVTIAHDEVNVKKEEEEAEVDVCDDDGASQAVVSALEMSVKELEDSSLTHNNILVKQETDCFQEEPGYASVKTEPVEVHEFESNLTIPELYSVNVSSSAHEGAYSVVVKDEPWDPSSLFEESEPLPEQSSSSSLGDKDFTKLRHNGESSLLSISSSESSTPISSSSHSAAVTQTLMLSNNSCGTEASTDLQINTMATTTTSANITTPAISSSVSSLTVIDRKQIPSHTNKILPQPIIVSETGKPVIKAEQTPTYSSQAQQQKTVVVKQGSTSQPQKVMRVVNLKNLPGQITSQHSPSPKPTSPSLVTSTMKVIQKPGIKLVRPAVSSKTTAKPQPNLSNIKPVIKTPILKTASMSSAKIRPPAPRQVSLLTGLVVNSSGTAPPTQVTNLATPEQSLLPPMLVQKNTKIAAPPTKLPGKMISRSKPNPGTPLVIPGPHTVIKTPNRQGIENVLTVDNTSYGSPHSLINSSVIDASTHSLINEGTNVIVNGESRTVVKTENDFLPEPYQPEALLDSQFISSSGVDNSQTFTTDCLPSQGHQVILGLPGGTTLPLGGEELASLIAAASTQHQVILSLPDGTMLPLNSADLLQAVQPQVQQLANLSQPQQQNLSYLTQDNFTTSLLDSHTVSTLELPSYLTTPDPPQVKMSAVGITKHGKNYRNPTVKMGSKLSGASKGAKAAPSYEERLRGQYEVLRMFKENPELYAKVKPQAATLKYKQYQQQQQQAPQNIHVPIPVDEAAEAVKFIMPEDYPCMRSLVKAAVSLHPLIQAGVDQTVHPYCAETRELWDSWPLGKQRAAEWHRACFTLRYLQRCLGGQEFKGQRLMRRRQLMDWCRSHGFSPVITVKSPTAGVNNKHWAESSSKSYHELCLHQQGQSYSAISDMHTVLRSAGGGCSSCGCKGDVGGGDGGSGGGGGKCGGDGSDGVCRNAGEFCDSQITKCTNETGCCATSQCTGNADLVYNTQVKIEPGGSYAIRGSDCSSSSRSYMSSGGALETRRQQEDEEDLLEIVEEECSSKNTSPPLHVAGGITSGIKRESIEDSKGETTQDDFLPLSEGGMFIYDELRKRGIKLQPERLDCGVRACLPAEMIYRVMQEFCSDILRETLDASVREGSERPEEMTIRSVHRGLTQMPEAAFCCNTFLGRHDDR